MVTDIKKLIEDYYKWLKDKTILRELKGSSEITTPFLDRHNDYIQIYILKNNGNFLLSDDGYTIDDLLSSGCSIDSPKRKKMLEVILNGHGIALDDNYNLCTTATNIDFPVKKHNLIQAIIDVNNMFYLANSTVESLFYEDVKTWFDSIEVRYNEMIPFTGKSGLSRTFDFVIPKSKKYPERLIKTLNHPNRQNADHILIDWLDIAETRPDNSLPIVFINDTVKQASDNVLGLFKNYEIETISWSNKDNFVEKLVA